MVSLVYRDSWNQGRRYRYGYYVSVHLDGRQPLQFSTDCEDAEIRNVVIGQALRAAARAVGSHDNVQIVCEQKDRRLSR